MNYIFKLCEAMGRFFIPHLAYFVYVIRHKWHVFLACLRLRVPLWMAIIHDASKFSPAEWPAYVHQFFNPDGSMRQVRDKSGAYDPNAQSLAFKYAWLSHQKNKHHWQAWVSVGDYGNMIPLPIPELYIREMVADWIGMARTVGNGDPLAWYWKNSDKILLHPESRTRIESLLTQYAIGGDIH